MSQSIQAVTFDVGGTLIEPNPSVGHLYAEVAASPGAPSLDPDLLNRRFRAAWNGFPRPLHSRTDWAELVDQVFVGLVDLPPSQSFFPRLYERFSEPDAWQVHSDVIPTLETLHQLGIRTAVLSNWDNRLRPLLHRLGLAPFFDPLVISCEIGAAKPDPAIFQFAASSLNLPPQRILHVGDDPELDFAGASEAKLLAVLIQRAPLIGTFPRVHSLMEIPQFIQSRRFSEP
jgi:putative hydrolase of the HAD superfamily